MACASACVAPGTHRSYGECLRSKGLAVMGLESTNPSFTRAAERRFEATNDAYAAARKEGLQPQAVSMKAVDEARRVADASS